MAVRGRPKLIPQAVVVDRYADGGPRTIVIGPKTYTRWEYHRLIQQLRQTQVLDAAGKRVVDATSQDRERTGLCDDAGGEAASG